MNPACNNHTTLQLINNNFKILSYKFISQHISIIKTQIGIRVIAVIGVYCIYNNNTSEHILIYENQLSIISSICDQFNDVGVANESIKIKEKIRIFTNKLELK
jgi:hypothetical protein